MLRSKSIALAIAFLLPGLANAATWYVKPVASGANNCSSWANACATLSSAKNKVTSNSDEIWVAAGVYKFSARVSNDMPGAYALKIYGGFAGTETAVDFRNAKKNVVVFSADTPADDSGVVGGITPSYANVGATATAGILSFTGTGVAASSPVNILDGVVLTGMHLKTTAEGGLVIQNAKAEINNVKFIGNKGHAPGVLISQAFSTAMITNTEFRNNYSLDDAAGNSAIIEGGAIYATGSTVVLTCDNCTFTGNRASGTGGAVRVMAGASVNILNSGFTSNIAETGAGGAINTDSTGVVNLTSNLFDSNQASGAASGNGGAIAATAGLLNIESNTFFGNTAGSTRFGGAINLGSGATQAVIKYSTFVNNTANGSGGKGGAINVNAAYPTTKPVISHSVFLNNSSPTGANISDMSSVTDGGYNVIGYAGAHNTAGTWTKPSSSQTLAETTLANIVEATLANNGGMHKSLKQAANSPLKNAVPNDLVLSPKGTTPANPFTSIAQARGAMASYGSYKAGKYYFDLAGTTFATYVDKDGYVLVASSDSLVTAAGAYTQVSTLTQRSDGILNSTIMAKFTTSEIDEVRISSYSNDIRGTFDGYSKDPDVINSLRTYSILNNSQNGGSWEVVGSSKAVNYFTATCIPSALTLNNGIYHACGNATGLHWLPSSSYEALTSSTVVKDDLDLWVRSSLGNCNGTVSADQRSLPRSDYVNPNDPNQYGLITACDIGAFEWNNGYQLDCWNEDGARPENSISGGTASVCFSDPNSLTPKALVDNFGYTHWMSLMMLAMLGLFRYKKSQI